MGILSKIFTWWDGATIGTLVNSAMTGVQVGTDSVYAATHQYGRDEANIPARPFLGLSSTDRREITAIIRDWAAELGFK